MRKRGGEHGRRLLSISKSQMSWWFAVKFQYDMPWVKFSSPRGRWNLAIQRDLFFFFLYLKKLRIC